MKPEDLQPNKTYQLTKDITNPMPDRRRARDWRYRETWEKGLRVHASTMFVGSRDDRIVIALHAGRYTSEAIYPHDSRYTSIVDALEQVDDFDSFMHEVKEETNASASEILEYMLEREQITRLMIRGAALHIAAREKAAEKAREAVEKKL